MTEPRRPSAQEKVRVAVGGHAHRVAAVLLLGGALVAAEASLDLGLGSASRPGSGLWPFMVSCFTALSAALLVAVDDPIGHERWSHRSFRIAGGLAALACFVGAFSVMGFTLPAALLMLFWLRVFTGEPWHLAVPLAAGTAAGLYLLFDVALGVPFPADVVLGEVFA